MQICNENLPTPGSGSSSRTSSTSVPSPPCSAYEFEVLEELLAEQFKGKEKLIAPNIKSLQLGVDYVQRAL